MDIPCTGFSDTNQEEVILSLHQVISSLSHLHPQDVTEVLLQNPLSCFGVTRVFWRSMGKNPTTAKTVLRVLLQQINKEVDQELCNDLAVVPNHGNLVSVMATSAIYEIVNALETSVDGEIFPQLLCALIRLISSTMGGNGRMEAGENSPRGLAVNTLKTIFKRQTDFNDTETVERFELMKYEQTHPAGVMALSKYMVASGSGHIGEVIRGLLPLLETSHQMHLLTSTAFFTELLYHPGVMDKKTAKMVIKAMISNSIYPNPVIRSLSIRALGNAANGAHKLICKYKRLVLRLLLDSTWDIPVDTNIAEESLKASEKFVRLLTTREMGEQLKEMIAFCHRFLDNEKQSVQISATLLLGELARKCQKTIPVLVAKYFKACLASLLLKLQSKDVEILSASMFCLYYCLPIVGCGDLQNLLQGQNFARGDDMQLKSIYKTLVEEYFSLAQYLVVRSNKFLCHLPLMSAALRQIGFLIEFMNYKDLKVLNEQIHLNSLLEDLAALSRYPFKAVMEAAKHTEKILAFKWTTARYHPPFPSEEVSDQMKEPDAPYAAFINMKAAMVMRHHI